jgi:phosphoserine aminotransferase
MTVGIPAAKPARPFFLGSLRQAAGVFSRQAATESLGRSHRAKIGKARLQLAST